MVGILDTARLDEAAERTPVLRLRGAVTAASESGQPREPGVLPMGTKSGEAISILRSYRAHFRRQVSWIARSPGESGQRTPLQPQNC